MANFDESQFDQPERLAELQLRVLMEEMLDRRIRVHVTGDVTRDDGAFMHALRKLEVTAERF